MTLRSGARSMNAAPYCAAPTTAATAVSTPACGSSSVAGPRTVHDGRDRVAQARGAPVARTRSAAAPGPSRRTPSRGRPRTRGSGSPRTPASMAKSPPASGCAGSIAWDPPPPIEVMNSVDRSGPPKAGIVGFCDGDGDLPIDRARRASPGGPPSRTRTRSSSSRPRRRTRRRAGPGVTRSRGRPVRWLASPVSTS